MVLNEDENDFVVSNFDTGNIMFAIPKALFIPVENDNPEIPILPNDPIVENWMLLYMLLLGIVDTLLALSMWITSPDFTFFEAMGSILIIWIYIIFLVSILYPGI